MPHHSEYSHDQSSILNPRVLLQIEYLRKLNQVVFLSFPFLEQWFSTYCTSKSPERLKKKY